jgi:hypothetical protein
VSEDRRKLEAQLRQAGLSDRAIKAAWPAWWRDDIDASPSARAELRFALARRLGLAPKPLLGERVEFLWKDKARFKYLSAGDALEVDAITSFGAAIGRLLIKATPQEADAGSMTPNDIRNAILAGGQLVDLKTLLSLCWAIGIPVIHLRVFPLARKSMHAMVIEDRGRHAILLGKDASYPAPIAFTLAHELGHIALDHIGGVSALVDLEDPATSQDKDDQEKGADEYALTLLTGRAQPKIETNIDTFNAPALAKAVIDAAPKYGIDPGTLALCLAYQRGIWPVAMSALKFIYGQAVPAWQMVNGIADSYLQWDEISMEAGDFLRNVMTDAHA